MGIADFFKAFTGGPASTSKQLTVVSNRRPVGKVSKNERGSTPRKTISSYFSVTRTRPSASPKIIQKEEGGNQKSRRERLEARSSACSVDPLEQSFVFDLDASGSIGKFEPAITSTPRPSRRIAQETPRRNSGPPATTPVTAFSTVRIFGNEWDTVTDRNTVAEKKGPFSVSTPNTATHQEQRSRKEPYKKQFRKFTIEDRAATVKWMSDMKRSDPEKLRRLVDDHVGTEKVEHLTKQHNLRKMWKAMMYETRKGEKFSQALEEAIHQRGEEIVEKGQQIDEAYVEKVMACGGGIRFYNYILVNSLLIPRHKKLHELSFSEFIDSLFYVGKGTDNRAVEHLKDTLKFTECTGRKLKSIPKLSHIDDIWKDGGAVHVMRVFHDVHEGVAHLREQAMISAIGVENLANERNGHHFNRPKGYTDDMLSVHGVYLLQRAHQVFVNNLPPPIRPINLHTDMVIAKTKRD